MNTPPEKPVLSSSKNSGGITSEVVPTPKEAKEMEEMKRPTNSLEAHYFLLAIIYFLVFILVKICFDKVNIQKCMVEYLGIGSMFATFGAAIVALGLTFLEDNVARVRENIDIFYKEIWKQAPWRRWPFLKRKERTDLFGERTIFLDLRNPEIPFDVGTHEIRISVPTVFEDFYDLPVWTNYWQSSRHCKAILTKLFRDLQEIPDTENEKRELLNTKMYSILCLRDVWYCILRYRVSKYVIHSGIAFILFSIMLTVLMIKGI